MPFRTILILIFLCASSIWSRSGAQEIHTKLEPAKIDIGDSALLSFEIQTGVQDQVVIWPDFPKEIASGVEVIRLGPIDTIIEGAGQRFRQTLTLTAFDSGNYHIPPFAFSIQQKGRPPSVLQSDSLSLAVATIDVDTTQSFKPINEIVEVDRSWLDSWKTFLALFAVLAVLFFLFRYLYRKRRSKKGSKKEIVTPETAHEKALRLLNALKEKNLWQNGFVKEYYEQLSMILRSYIENRFEIPAMELTTNQLLQRAKKDPRLKQVRPELRRVLTTADLAKYAKAEPLASEQEACWERSVEIVQKTKMNQEEGVQ